MAYTVNVESVPGRSLMITMPTQHASVAAQRIDIQMIDGSVSIACRMSRSGWSVGPMPGMATMLMMRMYVPTRASFANSDIRSTTPSSTMFHINFAAIAAGTDRLTGPKKLPTVYTATASSMSATLPPICSRW